MVVLQDRESRELQGNWSVTCNGMGDTLVMLLLLLERKGRVDGGLHYEY